ncbi:sulfatase-like hydrolase/transferase [Rubritalea spongiae]|uniref:Sulfatase-like hydrolase/transferase n=1 Tax=Rubritalea spongiae TaxID=430797 RepID=A0ABW5E269_9BACT
MKRLLLSIPLVLALYCSASAQIKVAVHENNTIAAGMSSRPDGTIVSTGSETWNNAVGQTAANIILADTNGSATSASLSYSAGFIKSNALGWESQSQDWVMMETWIGFKQNESLTVSDLPANYASGYSVVIYGDSNDGNTRTMDYFIDDGSGTKTSTILDAGYFNGSFSIDKTVTITGLTGTSFTLTGNPNSNDSRSAICGFEIIPGAITSIPSFEADDHYVQSGTEVTLSWSANNATTLTLNPGNIDVTGSTSLNVTPTETTTYTLTAAGESENATAEVTVSIGPEVPNIIIFLVDDFGVTDTSVPFAYDSYNDSGSPLLTGFNNFYKTPNMETLAAQGMKFTQAYAMPVCSPTRTSVMTGHNSPRHGITVHLNLAGTIDNNSFAQKSHRGPNNWRYMGMDATDVTLPQLLSNASYRSIHCGKGHFGGKGRYAADPTAIGFDVNIAGSSSGQPARYISNSSSGFESSSRAMPGMEAYTGSGAGTYLTDALTIEMNSAISTAVSDGVPFFGYMSYYAVHSPFTYNPGVDASAYSSGVSTNHKKFATMVEGVDISLGNIIQHLDSLGVAEDTLILFMGDNGSDSPALNDEGQIGNANFNDFPMRGKKGSAYEGGTRVPLIIAWAKPDTQNAFQQALPIVENAVEHDIVSLMDIAPTILSICGVDHPYMDGFNLSPYLLGQSGSHRPQQLISYVPHEHRSDYFLWYREPDWKLIYRFYNDSFELYNLTSDPDESDNLSSAQPEKVLTMARAMAAELDNSWGDLGELWPTLNPTQVAVPARPLEDDPFYIPFDVDGRDSVDTDADGLTDALEDTDANGLLGTSETNADDWDTDDDNTDDYTETRLNLDPRDPNKTFTVRATQSAEDIVTLTWPSAPGLKFDILSSPNLGTSTPSWTPLFSDLDADATESETSQEIQIDFDRKFFSIQLKP